MSIVREEEPLAFDLTSTSGVWTFFFGKRWNHRLFATTWDYVLDVRSVVLGTGATVEFKPVTQFASTRFDRPDDPGVITAGSVVTNGTSAPSHYVETPSGISSKGLCRSGVGIRLSALGTQPIARGQGLLYAAWRPMGTVLPAEEVIVNPMNTTTEWNIYPLARGKPIAARAVDKLNFIVFGEGNLNTTMEYWFFVRAYNDPYARGDWSLCQGTVQAPTTVNFDFNTGDVSFPAGITLAGFQWFDAALGVRKTSGGSPSRTMFRVIPAIKYV